MKRYKSEFGYGILAFITLPMGSILGLMLYLDEPFEGVLTVVGIMVSVCLFFVYINLVTVYTVTDDGILRISCGPFHNKGYDVNKIRSIAKSSSLISAPAPSLKRIELTYGKYDLIIVSPKDKNGFAEHLTTINPAIHNKLAENKGEGTGHSH